MKVPNNLSLRDVDADALVAARRLQEMMSAPRLDAETPSEEDEDESTDDDETSGEEDDPSDDEEPVSAEEAKAIRQALKKANAEAKKYRLEAKELKKKTASDDEKATMEAVEEATKEVESRYKGFLVAAEAKSALTEAGLASGHDRFLKMLDLDAIEVEEDGTIEGLDEQVAALKTDFPEVFGKKKGAPGKADAAPKAPTSKKMSSAERIAAQLGR